MKHKAMHALFDYIIITFGTFIFALGLNMFLVPVKISVGGVASIATMLFYTLNIPLSVTNIICNAVLFIFGYKFLGKASLIKTIYGILTLSLFLELTNILPPVSDSLIICAVSGGIVMGAGVGIVIRRDGSTGGSDLAALILNRLFPHFSVAKLILIIDFAIIIIAGFVFRSFTVTFYSLVSLYAFTKVTDFILTMGDYAKSAYILSSKSQEISQAIMMHFHRGVTGIFCTGMFSSDEKTMLMCIVTAKELPIMINIVRSIDKSSFIIISDVREVLGQGFKLKTSYDEIAK